MGSVLIRLLCTMVVGKVGVLLLLLGSAGGQRDKCCQSKTVASGPKAGTYHLVTTSDTLPDFCLGGCVYTKESDTVPGTNYCFQAGEGTVTCSSGGGCGGGDVEGWIEKYFEKQCSQQINGVLQVNLYKRYMGQQCSGYGYWSRVGNVTLELFDRPACEGKPVQEKFTKTDSERFLIRVEHTDGWSVRASSEKYQTTCQDIGNMVPFTNNWASISLQEVVKEAKIERTASVDFSFDINNELLPDLFVQSNPFSCTNSSFGPYGSPFKSKQSRSNKRNKKYRKRNQKKKLKKAVKKTKNGYELFVKNPAKHRQYGSGCGSGWGSGGWGCGGGSNWKCRPTCTYTAYATEYSLFPCECRGVVGGGLNYSNIELPSQNTPAGSAGVRGRIDWYDDPSLGQQYQQEKYFTTYAEFVRRNMSDLELCDSKFSLTWMSPDKTQKVTKTVPCFTKPLPPPTVMPTYPTTGGSGNQPVSLPMSSDPVTPSPSVMDSGSGSLFSGMEIPDSIITRQYVKTLATWYH